METADALKVVEAEVAAGRRFVQVGFMRRYDRAYLELRTAMTDGTIGEPLLAHACHRNPKVPDSFVYRWSGPDEDERAAAVRYWKRAIEITVELGCNVMNSEFNGRPEHASKSEGMFWKSMEELLPVFEREDAFAAAVAWAVISRRLSMHTSGPLGTTARGGSLPWRSRPAWLLVVFMSVQSAMAYAYLGWLAPAYVQRGWSAFAAGALVGVNNLAQLCAALTLPALADRITAFRSPVVAVVSLSLVGSLWLWLWPGVTPMVAAVVLGLGLGGGFSLGLTRMVQYASDAQASSRLTAMVFLISYSFAAAAPVLVGRLHDLTGAFSLPFGLLTLLALTQWAVAGRLGPHHLGAVG